MLSSQASFSVAEFLLLRHLLIMGMFVPERLTEVSSAQTPEDGEFSHTH